MYPLITIVTVCYNSANTIEETIKSVIDQSYFNIEYIIIDGGSKDGTIDIIRKYEKQIDFWISEKDNGIYDAMNKGIEKATGELIGFINSDDFYAKDAIKAIAEGYVASNADVLYGDLITVDLEGRQIVSKSQDDLTGFYCAMMIPHPSTFCKTKWCKQYRMDTKYRIASDYKFLLQLYHTGKRFFHINKVISFFRISGISNRKEYICAYETKDISLKMIDGNTLLKDKYEQKIQIKYKGSLLRLIAKRAQKNGYFNKWLSKFCRFYNQLIIFGTGEIASFLYLQLKVAGGSIEAFLDNDKRKQGKLHFGIKTISPEVLKSLSNKIILVASTKYEDEIECQLRSVTKLRAHQIIRYTELRERLCIDYIRENRWFRG